MERAQGARSCGQGRAGAVMGFPVGPLRDFFSLSLPEQGLHPRRACEQSRAHVHEGSPSSASSSSSSLCPQLPLRALPAPRRSAGPFRPAREGMIALSPELFCSELLKHI